MYTMYTYYEGEVSRTFSSYFRKKKCKKYEGFFHCSDKWIRNVDLKLLGNTNVFGQRASTPRL